MCSLENLSLTFFRLLRRTMKNLRVGFIVNSLNRIGDEENVKDRRISSI